MSARASSCLLALGEIRERHRALREMAILVSQADALYENFRVLLQQHKKFEPRQDSALLDFNLQDTLELAKTLVAQDFSSLRNTTLISLCSAVEIFMKTVVAEKISQDLCTDTGAEFFEYVDQADKILLNIRGLKPARKYLRFLADCGIQVDPEMSIQVGVDEAILVRNAVAHNDGIPGKWLLESFPKSFRRGAKIVIPSKDLNFYEQSLWNFCRDVYTVRYGPLL